MRTDSALRSGPPIPPRKTGASACPTEMIMPISGQAAVSNIPFSNTVGEVGGHECAISCAFIGVVSPALGGNGLSWFPWQDQAGESTVKRPESST